MHNAHNTQSAHSTVALFGIFFAIALAAIPLQSGAQTNADSEANTPVTINLNVNAGIGPGSSLYILDTIAERISIWFASGGEEEVAVLLKLAEEKIAESAQAAGTDEKAADVAARRYETYMKEAVEKAKKVGEQAASDKTAEETTEATAEAAAVATAKTDELLFDIGAASYEHIDAFVAIGSHAATKESEYIDRVFSTLQEQEIEIIKGISNEETRAQSAENLLNFLQEKREQLPPGVEEQITKTLESLIGGIAAYIQAQGGALLDQLGDKAKEYAKQQAQQQLDKAKQQLIEKIDDIEL